MVSEALTLFPDLILSTDEQTTGLLPYQSLLRAVERGYFVSSQPIESRQIQPSSVDMRLGSKVFRIDASFLPGGRSRVTDKLRDLVVEEIEISSPTLLKKGQVYLVPLMEELKLPGYLWGKANPKSTTGRLDIFTRLLCDFGDEFDVVPNGYKGSLYAEVAPRTFDIVVRAGATLNQIRLVKGRPEPSQRDLLQIHESGGLVYIDRSRIAEPTISKKSLWLSLDLEGSGPSEIVGYKAKTNAPPIEISRIGYYDPAEYWEAIRPSGKPAIILAADAFYILASKERVRVPAEYAAEMVPFDPAVGEFRIHYAGFFDPGFGCRSDDLRGTHAVLEVRSHGIPFLVEDGQKIGRLIFEQMLSVPAKLYGAEIGSSYQFQRLALSKQFKPWS